MSFLILYSNFYTPEPILMNEVSLESLVYSINILLKKNIPDTASRSPTTRSSSSTRYRTVLCTTSTKSEPNRVVRGESARPARERRARTRSTPPKRLKQNETVKKTPLAYIDVTVTWRRITDSNRHRNRATLALNSVAKSSVSHHCFVVIVRSNFQ